MTKPYPNHNLVLGVYSLFLLCNPITAYIKDPIITERDNYLRSLSKILMRMAPRLPKQSVSSSAILKQLTPSGTFGPISATIAKLCLSSSILSSTMSKTCSMVYLCKFAGTVTALGSSVKSSPYGKYRNDKLKATIFEV